MQVTEIKRTMSFGKFENVTMTARLKEGDDPLRALFKLEQLMTVGIARHESSRDYGAGRCRVCGCTDDFGCEGGCSWVEEDLCSTCAAIELVDRLQAEVTRCRELEREGRLTKADLGVVVAAEDALMSGEFEFMRDALTRIGLVGALCVDQVILDAPLAGLFKRLEEELRRCSELPENYICVNHKDHTLEDLEMEIMAAEAALESGDAAQMEYACTQLARFE